MKKALTIAGSDSGGGAGIQADLKTFMAFGVYGMSAITALTAQNTVGVQGICRHFARFRPGADRSVMTDIGTDAAKTGMLSNAAIVKAVAEAVREFPDSQPGRRPGDDRQERRLPCWRRKRARRSSRSCCRSPRSSPPMFSRPRRSWGAGSTVSTR